MRTIVCFEKYRLHMTGEAEYCISSEDARILGSHDFYETCQVLQKQELKDIKKENTSICSKYLPNIFQPNR